MRSGAIGLGKPAQVPGPTRKRPRGAFNFFLKLMGWISFTLIV